MANGSVLYLQNDWTTRVRLKRFDPLSSARVDASGLNVTAVIAATAGGDALAPALSLPMTEGATGDYSAVFPAADLDAALATYAGQTIYERTFTNDGSFDESRPLLVAVPRIGQ